jgi:membrane protease subunit (stomatin/prohibitin family)
MTDEQQQLALDGINLLLKAAGSPTLDSIVGAQSQILQQVPEEQREFFMNTIMQQTSEQFAEAMKTAVNIYGEKIKNAKPEDILGDFKKP